MSISDLILTPNLRQAVPAMLPLGRPLFTDGQLQRESTDTLKRFLRCKLDNYRVALQAIHEGQKVYRGVVCRDLPELVSHLSYPPADKVRNGRANRAGVPMLYCSAAAPAVPFELRAKPGDLDSVGSAPRLSSSWRGTNPSFFKALGHLANDFLAASADAAAKRLVLAVDGFRLDPRRRRAAAALTDDVLIAANPDQRVPTARRAYTELLNRPACRSEVGDC